MKKTEIVWRVLVDEALDGHRRWANAADLAWQAGCHPQLAYKALRRPIEIGAVTKQPGGGFSVVDPERVLMLLAAQRKLVGSGVATSIEAAERLIRDISFYAVGGSRAAVHHLGGANTVSDHARALLYVPDDTDPGTLPPGDSALVLLADERSLRSWKDGYTSVAQTCADLFAQPGWQASEFRRALWRELFAVDDWSRVEATGA